MLTLSNTALTLYIVVIVLTAGRTFADEEFVCSFCPNGGDPNYPQDGSFISRECDAAVSAAPESTEEDCLALHESPDPAICGCEGASLPDESCALCPDSQFSGENLVNGLVTDFLNCDELEIDLIFFEADGSERCTEFQGSETIPALCGCNIPDFVPCNFCTGDVVPLVENILVCEDLMEAALLSGSADSEECSAALAELEVFCECVTPSEDLCAGVCPDGSVPIEMDVVLPDGFTCGELDAIIKESDQRADSDLCLETQANNAISCACPGVSTCGPLCDGGDSVPNPNFEIPGTGGLTCGGADTFLQTAIPDFSALCLDKAGLQNIQIFCQCPNVDTCPGVCPDGQVPPNEDFIFPIEGSGLFTCQDLDLLFKNLPGGETCDLQQGVLSLVCECPGVETLCTICEDGSNVPDPSLTIDDTFTCGELEDLFGLDVENCATSQGIAGTYCGCSNPIADSQICRICGDGVLLPDPSASAQIGELVDSCAEVEQVANLGDSDCSAFQTQYSSDCCADSSIPASPTPAAPMPPLPVTASPIVPAPVTPAPATADPTPAPTALITPAPITADPTPAPITPTPAPTALITPAPVTADPTPAPITPTPAPTALITPAPVTADPTPAPVTADPTPSPITPTPAPITKTPEPTPVTPPPIETPEPTVSNTKPPTAAPNDDTPSSDVGPPGADNNSDGEEEEDVDDDDEESSTTAGNATMDNEASSASILLAGHLFVTMTMMLIALI